jgi:hypothetical protein
LWVDEDFEMIAVEVKGMEPKHTWEIIGIYRAKNEDLTAIERHVQDIPRNVWKLQKAPR